MKKIRFRTSYKKLPADIYTPVSIYLRLRDRFRDTVLLESTDFHAGENSFSFIGIQAVAGIEISDLQTMEGKLPGEESYHKKIADTSTVIKELQDFIDLFETENAEGMPVQAAQGFFGYSSFDAVQVFENIHFTRKPAQGIKAEKEIPLMRYRLYQYVIIINHFKDELYICENHFKGIESRLADVETWIKSRDIPHYPFYSDEAATSNMDDETFTQNVVKGIAACKRGDVFQVVLSRQYRKSFKGDEFNVYRALRSVNPSPYLFYFDYGDYRLFGSSPESQLVINDGEAVIHPIAGTFRRSGNDADDAIRAAELQEDEKENAEHVMLVDLARNDLSRVCENVTVSSYKKIQYYSHVIHMVSEVKGKLREGIKPFMALASSFPAGTLSGAPKYKAMEIINSLEATPRGFYGGAIGIMGLNGNCNHAIMIRSFLSRQNELICQAGAGVVVNSNPQNELQEVENKLGALKAAIELAKTF